MSENLALWTAVEKTPASHTKTITGKSYQGTSPRPHHLIHKATETFGPCGIGWGFTIVDERIEEGAGGEKMSIARVRVWYEWGGKRGEVEHIGGTSFSGTRSSGKPFTDEDAPKKSVTDALVKALSMIGFAGDIFMGRYDDSKYVADIKHEEKQATERPKQDAAPKQEAAPKPVSAAEMKHGLDEITQELLDCRTPNDAQKVWKNWVPVFKEQRWGDDYITIARERIQARGVELKAAFEAAEVFPGDLQSTLANSHQRPLSS